MPFIDLNPPGSGSSADGDATVTISAVCSALESIGDVVYISGDRIGLLYQVAKVDITTTHKMPGVGLIIQKPTSTTAVVLLSGEATGIYTGLTPGKMLFAGFDSQLTEVAPGSPVTGINNVQIIAHALASDTIFVNVDDPTIRVSN